MTRDGRSLDHRTLETIRTMAVTRVREGERPSVVIASYGFHRCTIYRWLKTTRGRGQRLTALASRPATALKIAVICGQRFSRRSAAS